MLSDERLSAYLDGELSPAEATRLEEALASDPEARERLELLRDMCTVLADTELVGPSRDLWGEIEAELDRPRGWRAIWSEWRLPAALVAAAALFVVLASAPEPSAPDQTPLAATPASGSAQEREWLESADSEIAEARTLYRAAIAKLEARAERYASQLPEQDRLALKTSLFEVEQAIARVEGVLHDNPHDVSANTTLVALYDQKMRVLKSTVEVSEAFLGQEKVKP